MRLRTLTATLALVAVAGSALALAARPDAGASVAASPQAQQVLEGVTLTPKAPTTPAGYARMFQGVSNCEWAGGDIALEAVMGQGRRVWLMGDSVSRCNGLVRNAALTQDGGTLRASHQGRQVLPNVGARWFWPEQVLRVDRATQTIVVDAREIKRVGQGAWGFEHTGRARDAYLHVAENGDVNWTSYGPWRRVSEPASDARPLDYGHWTYLEGERQARVEGRPLVVASQNWDDDYRDVLDRDVNAYLPLFS